MKKLLGTLLFIFVATNAPASDMNNFEDMADFDDGDIPVDHVIEIVHENYLVDDSGTLHPINEGESDSGFPVNSETLPPPPPNSERESNDESPVNSETLPSPNSAGGSNGGKFSVNSTEMVEAHNKWRAMVGVNAIKWSKKLQDDALVWAEKIREQCELTHASNQDLTSRDQGENLFYASPIIYSDGRKTLNTSITPSTVVDDWGSEKAGWVNAPPHCDTSKEGAKDVCGHYTQVVWKTTTEVGCAAVTCSDSAQLWVCRYSPAGNYDGKAPY